MNFQHMISPTFHHAKPYNKLTKPHALQRFHQPDITYYFTSRNYQKVGWKFSRSLKHAEEKRSKLVIVNLKEKPEKISKKSGTVVGAVALIIGTSIGSGILALPKKTSPAGLIPSSISMTICWAFLLIEALLLVEINVGLLKEKKIAVGDDNELEIISIRTMAQKTLGDWGGNLATVTYVFLGYTSMIAYSSKSGEILFHLINLPESISGFFFTAIFSILIAIGGTRATDQVNQWLTASMIGLLVAIEVIALMFGGWSGFEGISGNWEKVPATLPVMIFTLVYHDLAPVLCAYLEGDLRRIRASVLLGSFIPLLALLIWEAIAFSLSAQGGQVSDPVELLMNVNWSGVPLMVEAFSLLAVGTSIIGTLLSFSEFFKEQLNNLLQDSTSAPFIEKSNSFIYISNWWRRNNVNLSATALVIAPPLLVSTLVPDAFSAATDIAGGYCMTILYGILPPAMAWSMNQKKGQVTRLTATSLALGGVGLFASGIVVEQVFQDFSSLHIIK